MIDSVLLDDSGIAKALLINKFTFEYSGKISVANLFNYWDTIVLEQKNGYKLNFFTRLDEIASNYNNKLSISYWITKVRKTAEELIEHNMLAADGYLSLNISEREIRYSEYTSDTDYTTNFKIGGHNLLEELKNHTGEYLYILIDVK